MSEQKVWGVKRWSKFFLNLSSSMPRQTGSFRVTPWHHPRPIAGPCFVDIVNTCTKTSSPQCFFFQRHDALHRYLLSRAFNLYGNSLSIVVSQVLLEVGFYNYTSLLLLCSFAMFTLHTLAFGIVRAVRPPKDALTLLQIKRYESR
jgi:hypothetical protein